MSASSPQVRGIIVFVKKQKRKNGRVYLSVVQGYRGEDGKTKTRHVRSLGYLDELEKAYDDPCFEPEYAFYTIADEDGYC